MLGPGAAALASAARVAPVAALAPPLGERSWGARVVIAAVLAAAVWPAARQASITGPLALALVHELLVGLGLGLTAAVPFRAAEAAGLIVDRARAPRPGRPLADAYLLLALALFAAFDGPRLVVEGLAQSYAAFPVGGALGGGGARLVLDQTAHLAYAAIALAAPVLAALLVADVIAGVALRIQPALAQAIGLSSVRTLVAVAAVGLAAAAGMRALLAGPGGTGIAEALRQAARALAGP